MTTDKDIVWEKARDLTIEIYAYFGISYDIDFENYICKSALAVCDGIAVGFNEQSGKKLIKLLYNSKGCTAELEAMLHLAERLKHIGAKKAEALRKKNREITIIINKLIQSNEK